MNGKWAGRLPISQTNEVCQANTHTLLTAERSSTARLSEAAHSIIITSQIALPVCINESIYNRKWRNFPCVNLTHSIFFFYYCRRKIFDTPRRRWRKNNANYITFVPENNNRWPFDYCDFFLLNSTVMRLAESIVKSMDQTNRTKSEFYRHFISFLLFTLEFHFLIKILQWFGVPAVQLEWFEMLSLCLTHGQLCASNGGNKSYRLKWSIF